MATGRGGLVLLPTVMLAGWASVEIVTGGEQHWSFNTENQVPAGCLESV